MGSGERRRVNGWCHVVDVEAGAEPTPPPRWQFSGNAHMLGAAIVYSALVAGFFLLFAPVIEQTGLYVPACLLPPRRAPLAPLAACTPPPLLAASAEHARLTRGRPVATGGALRGGCTGRTQWASSWCTWCARLPTRLTARC